MELTVGTIFAFRGKGRPRIRVLPGMMATTFAGVRHPWRVVSMSQIPPAGSLGVDPESVEEANVLRFAGVAETI